MEVIMDCENATRLKPRESRPSQLKKHVAAIHSGNTLSLLQRKITNALLFFAFPHLKEKNQHQISIGQLCQFIGYNSRDYVTIKDALRALLTTLIEWNIVSENVGEEDWTASTYLASVNIKGAVCTYEYSLRLRELLSYPTVYGKINLVVQSRFKSIYGLVLYENCARYQGMPFTKWFDIPLFKKLMGVPESNYAQFSDFKKRVLDKAIDEVNTHSDLLITPEYEHVGRAVKKVRFLIKERPKKNRLGPSTDKNQVDLRENLLYRQLLDEFSLNDKTAKQLLDEHGPEKIKAKIEIIKNSKNYKLGKVPNSAGYLIDALRRDYQLPTSLSQRKTEENKVINSDHKRLCNEYDDYISNQISVWFSKLQGPRKDSIKSCFSAYLKDHLPREYALYKQSGLLLVRDEFNRFIKVTCSEQLNGFMTIEQFSEEGKVKK